MKKLPISPETEAALKVSEVVVDVIKEMRDLRLKEPKFMTKEVKRSG